MFQSCPPYKGRKLLWMESHIQINHINNYDDKKLNYSLEEINRQILIGLNNMRRKIKVSQIFRHYMFLSDLIDCENINLSWVRYLISLS